MPKTFTCDNCKQTFDEDDSDDERAIAEMESDYGRLEESERAVLCDCCYATYKAWEFVVGIKTV